MSPSPRKSARQTAKEFTDLQRLAAGEIMRPLDLEFGTTISSKVAESFIKPNDRLTSLERIEIYNRQYWFRLVDCLYDDYPGLLSILGQKKFSLLTRKYLAKYPSTSFTLRNLGKHLVEFITDEPKWVAPHTDLAREMAEFEWAQIVAFDEGEMAPITVDDLLGVNPAKLKLAIQPFITLLDLHWPLDDYTMSLKKAAVALRSEASNAIETDETQRKIIRKPVPKKKRTFVAIHRHDFDLYYKRLEPKAFTLLSALAAGKSLAAACEIAYPTAEQVRDWFQNWTEMGWLCKRGGELVYK